MKSIKARLAALEQRLITEPLVLHYEDGTTEPLYVRDLANLFARACREWSEGRSLSPDVDKINRAVSVDEPGGSRLADLVKALVASPPGDDPVLDASE